MVGIWPSFSFLVFLSPSPFLSSSLKTCSHFLTLCLPLFSVCCRCLELVCSISAPFFLPFLPPFHLYRLSLPLFISASLPQLEQSILPTHTKGSVSLYYTPPLAQPPNRHTQLFLYAACLQEPPRMSNSLIRAPGRKKQPPFLDTDQGGALDQLLLAQC